jgi:uncharacterized protein YpiB (UPF0302 family)
MVLGPEKTHEDDDAEKDIAKGTEVEEVATIAIEFLDRRKSLKEIDTGLFIIDKQDFYDLFEAFKKLHGNSGDVSDWYQERCL